MGLVIGDLVLLIVIALSIGLVFLVRAFRQERLASRLKAENIDELRRKTLQEAKRFEPGIELVCLNCDIRFSGPMPNDGCPNCHLTSLVITLEEFNQKPKSF